MTDHLHDRQLGGVSVRRAVADDQRFIASSWWHSAVGRNRAPRIRHRVNAQIDRVLDDGTTCALVAERGDRIIGWLVYASAPVGRVVHYLYVRDADRGHGVATRLVQAAWPKSEARIVLTMRGPSTQRFMDEHRNSMFVAVDEFLG